MAKKKVVTKKQLEDAGFNNLRDYMNAFKFDPDKGKYVKREKALTRRKDSSPPETENKKPKIIKDSRSDRPNISPFAKSTAPKRADADNMVPSRSTASDSSKVKGTKNLVTEDSDKKGGNPVFSFKKGGVVSKGGSVRKAAKKKSIDGIAKKGKTKGRFV